MTVSAPRVARLHLARKDREAVREAQAIYKALVHWLKNVGTLGGMPKDRKGRFFVPGYRFLPESKARGLVIYFEPEGHETYYTNDGNLIVTPRVHRSVPGQSPAEVALAIVTKNRDRVVHELTHHIDRLRMGEGWAQAEKGYRTPKEDPAAYYNDPLEMNAFFHAGIDELVDEFEEAVSSLRPRDPENNSHQISVMFTLPRFARISFDDFFDEVQRKWPRKNWARPHGFWESLTPANQRRFKKRVYDLWAKLRKEARETIRKLQKAGDPAAERVKL